MKPAKVLRVAEAAARLDVSAQTIRNWIRDGIIPATQPVRVFLIPRDAVERLAQGKPVESATSVATMTDAV
jgi:excisionase family DNA binding protein